jgi:4-deoxy-L-threo-5-hexosulose-uronate ketol-isomerase
MKTNLMADPVRYPRMKTAEIRETFLIDSLYKPGQTEMRYIELDRAVVGMAVPLESKLILPTDESLKAEYFAERREIGVLNIGSRGFVTVGAARYDIGNLDCLYVGRGNPDIMFESEDPESPAVFYLLSYPAHVVYPTTLIRSTDVTPMELGSPITCNHRTVCKYIFVGGARSCQLVMGVTRLKPGSSWNTMPAHTHMRRSEIYMYFNLSQDARVFHMMGPAEETRHIVMKDRDAVVSPGWSIHAGVGTEAYSFCWGMGGENQDYADMDPVPLHTLR